MGRMEWKVRWKVFWKAPSATPEKGTEGRNGRAEGGWEGRDGQPREERTQNSRTEKQNHRIIFPAAALKPVSAPAPARIIISPWRPSA
jgi:hypothetical protein